MKRRVSARLIAAVVVVSVSGCPKTESSREWQEVLLPAGGLSETALASVSCAPADACVAVGQGDGKALAFGGLAPGQRPVRHWPVATPPSEPADPGTPVSDRMASVSCTSEAWCTAVGTRDGGLEERELIWRWQGDGWRTDESAPGSGLRLQAVSCAATQCMALPRGSQALRGDGSTWALVPAWTGYFGYRVDCWAPDRCVGMSQFWHSGVTASIHRWNGTAWTSEWHASGPTAGGWPLDVACSPAGDCVAVGVRDRSPSGTAPEAFALVSRGGGSWIQENPPAELGRLSAVSCYAATTCVAIPQAGASGRYGVWESASGWRLATAIVVPDAGWESVSCMPAGGDVPARCVVVGTRHSTGAPTRAVAYRFGV